MTVVQAASGAIAEAPDAHQAFPIEDSWYEEASQHPANLRAFGAYPVIAVCKGCHGRIRRAGLGREWEHVRRAGG